MSARGLVLSDGAGATELGVSQERAKVALFGPDGTTELCAVDGASSTAISYLPVAARDRGLARLRALNVDRRGSLELGTLDVVSWDSISPSRTTAPDNMYLAAASTFVPTYGGDGYRFNPGGSTGNGSGTWLKSVRTFPLRFGQPLTYIVRAKITPSLRPYGGATPGSGVFSEIGFSDANAPLTDNSLGAFFLVQNGVMTPVLAPNGRSTWIRGRAMEFAEFGARYVDGFLSPQAFYEWQVIVDLAAARFIIRGESGQIVYDETIQCPATIPRLWSGGSASFTASVRHHNRGNPLAAGDLHMTESVVGYYGRAFTGRSWPAVASEHRPVTHTPDTHLAAPIWTNSAEPASQTLANNSSVNGVSGKFQFAAPGGLTNDYGIMSPPNYSVHLTGLIITGISIDTWNVGAPVATTPTHIQWFFVPCTNGASAGAGAGSTGRVALGAQSFAVGTPIGGTPDRQINRSFQTPIVFRTSVGQTRWFTLCARIAVGTATASQVIAGFWSIEGYWE